MVRRILSICLIVVTAAAFGNAASAEGYRSHKTNERAAAIKDCTRLNGRYGYYGNPWCTPAEQARFDRWQARQFRVR